MVIEVLSGNQNVLDACTSVTIPHQITFTEVIYSGYFGILTTASSSFTFAHAEMLYGRRKKDFAKPIPLGA